MHRAAGRSERHIDSDMPLFVYIHSVDQAQVNDIDTELRIIDVT